VRGRDHETRINPGDHPVSGRFTSIATKLAVGATALIVLVTTIVYVNLTRYQRQTLLQSKEITASAVSRLFADWCVAGVVFDDEGTIKEALATLGRNGEIEYAAVWAVDSAGKVDHRIGQLERGKPEPLPGVSQEMQLERRADRLVLSSPVRDLGKKIVAMAVVAFSLARENAAIVDVERTTLVISIAVALGFMLVLTWITRFAVSAPLAKLVVAAKQLEEGKRGEVEVRSNDEVGQLAHAFRSMTNAIRVREDRISAGNRDMRLVLDNVGQGFIALDSEGTMSAGRSTVVDKWFGVSAGPVKFWDYLSQTDTALGDWFELGWAALREDILPLSLCLEQLPGLAKKGAQTFELTYRPIVEGGGLAKMIVVITDVTARIERERAEQTQREMMSIFRHILSDRVAIDGFFCEAAALVASLTSPAPTAAEIVEPALLKRQVHTLKGNCALFGIESVAHLCHQLENRLSESPDPLSPAETQGLRAQWDAVSVMYAQLTESRSETAIDLDQREYEAFVSELQARLGQDRLLATALTWQFEPASKRLVVVGEQIQALAVRLGKAVVEIVYEPTDLRLPPRKWGPFWSTFTHVIRNAVDHGMETEVERIAAGKTKNGTVALGLKRDGHHVVVTITDDGRGINWPKIARRAKEYGLPHATRADLEEALFFQGLSSRDDVTTTSGRGVGLSTIRDLVRDLGGTVEIRSEMGFGTTFRFLMPQSMLFDELAVVQDRNEPIVPRAA
jgi:two-component system, chemotaxis family, sensor kinase CheA